MNRITWGMLAQYWFLIGNSSASISKKEAVAKSPLNITTVSDILLD